MSHGDPKNPQKNPHPVKRYEVTATADAPGPWDSVKGVAFFDVINKDCVPKDSFTGGQNVPNVGYDFEMTRVDEKTWKGYVYRDLLVDEDYFDKGVCHWDVTGIAPVFTVHGRTFGAATTFEDDVKGAQLRFFKKNDFLNRSPNPYGALLSVADSPDVLQSPDAFFLIKVTVKEVSP